MTAADPLGVEVPARPAPDRSRGRPGRHLRPVDKQRPRRSPAVPVVVGAGIVVVALFALAAMHGLLIHRQIRLDDRRQEAAAQAEEVRRLRLEVAELEAPDRVLEVARTRLGMVDPTEVGYLLPASVEAGDAEPVRVAPAEPPPRAPDTGDETGSSGDDTGTSGEGAGTSGEGAGTAGEGAGTAGDDTGTSGDDRGTAGDTASPEQREGRETGTGQEPADTTADTSGDVADTGAEGGPEEQTG